MKKIAVLVIAIFMLQSCISVRVNTDVERSENFAKADNPNIKAQGTFFEKGVGSLKWSNSNGSNWTKARFKKSSGVTYIKLDVKKKISVDFRLNADLKGLVKLEIIDEKDNVLFERKLTNSNQEYFTIDFPNSGNYKIRWDSQSATGNYFLEWREN